MSSPGSVFWSKRRGPKEVTRAPEGAEPWRVKNRVAVAQAAEERARREAEAARWIAEVRARKKPGK
jgi:hypothetical protein